VHALTAYKRGDKVMNGRNNAIMAGMAQPLSDRDMADIAAYLQSLPGPLVIRK
jgi:cytochrome c553